MGWMIPPPIWAWLLLSGTRNWMHATPYVSYSIIFIFNWPPVTAPVQHLYSQMRYQLFASLQLLQTKNNSKGGTKDESPLFRNFFDWDVDGAGIANWIEKGCPYCAVLC